GDASWPALRVETRDRSTEIPIQTFSQRSFVIFSESNLQNSPSLAASAGLSASSFRIKITSILSPTLPINVDIPSHSESTRIKSSPVLWFLLYSTPITFQLLTKSKP